MLTLGLSLGIGAPFEATVIEVAEGFYECLQHLGMFI